MQHNIIVDTSIMMSDIMNHQIMCVGVGLERNHSRSDFIFVNEFVDKVALLVSIETVSHQQKQYFIYILVKNCASWVTIFRSYS